MLLTLITYRALRPICSPLPSRLTVYVIRVAPYVRAIYLSNLGKMSIMFQPRGFVAGIRIFGRFMAVSAVELRRFGEL